LLFSKIKKGIFLEEVMENNKLYVGNLDYSVESAELQTLFATYGEVKSIKILEGKGFGFVEMSSQDEAESAKKALNGQDFKGRALKIDIARPQTSRNGGGGRSFDRGGQRGGGGGGQRGGYGRGGGGRDRNDEY
jgi:RNA recognition motif-containing protein